MITGDNPLTACHVAKELLFTQKKGGTLILTRQLGKENSWAWQSIDETKILPLEENLNDCDKLTDTYDLCVTGDVNIFILNIFIPVLSSTDDFQNRCLSISGIGVPKRTLSSTRKDDNPACVCIRACFAQTEGVSHRAS